MSRNFRRFLVFFFVLIAGITTSAMSVKAFNKLEDANYLLPDYFCDVENTENLSNLFDYNFEGVITRLLHVSQYNGNGTDIPYTYYQVRVTKEIKGELEKEVIIKYYGGYNQENELILLENSELPKIGLLYTFYCNQTTLNYRSDERTITGSYVISNPSCLVKGRVKVEEPEVVARESLSFPKISTTSIYQSLVRDELSLSLLDTTSSNPFDSATAIGTGYSFIVLIPKGGAKYLKITRNTLDYLAIFSTGTLDLKVSVYDENYNLIGSNDDVGYTRGREYTTGLNFFYNFYADINKTYYFEVSAYSPTVSGVTHLKCIVDNYYVSDYSDLVKSSDAVDRYRKIHYTNETNYPTSIKKGAAEWSKLGTIEILEDTSSTCNDVDITQYIDPDGIFVAYVTNHWLWGWEIHYNNSYFMYMSAAERQKTVMHEFGHTLGFSEFSSSDYSESNDNVMVQGIRAQTRLGPADIAVNRQKWG